MQNYFVTIVEESTDREEMFKVAADNHVAAIHIAMGAYNGVDPDEIDLDCAQDIDIHVTAEDDVKDLTA
jgi:hypothetical protein